MNVDAPFFFSGGRIDDLEGQSSEWKCLQVPEKFVSSFFPNRLFTWAKQLTFLPKISPSCDCGCESIRDCIVDQANRPILFFFSDGQHTGILNPLTNGTK